MVMFLWMMPMPPSCAMVMARRASVTVSMAAESSGTFRRMRRVSWVQRSTSRGENFRVGRDQQDVVEGESFFEYSHAQLYAPGPLR